MPMSIFHRGRVGGGAIAVPESPGAGIPRARA